jgi:hypothetical protein
MKRLVVFDGGKDSHVATQRTGFDLRTKTSKPYWAAVCGKQVPQSDSAEIAGNLHQATCAECRYICSGSWKRVR